MHHFKRPNAERIFAGRWHAHAMAAGPGPIAGHLTTRRHPQPHEEEYKYTERHVAFSIAQAAIGDGVISFGEFENHGVMDFVLQFPLSEPKRKLAGKLAYGPKSTTRFEEIRFYVDIQEINFSRFSRQPQVILADIIYQHQTK